MRRKICAVLGLGSNLGRRTENIASALRLLSGFCDIDRVSSVYKTKSLLRDGQGDYFNICALIHTDFTPSELLLSVKNIEKVLGRENTGRWYTRVIDIDIIDYDGSVTDLPDLKIPHPGMETRSFVLYPLKEILPGYKHPVSCRTVDDMVKSIYDTLDISSLGVCLWRS